MTAFSDWLDAERGRAAMLADRYGITREAVSQWRDQVPRRRLLDLSRVTGISVEDLLDEEDSNVASSPD